jgi:hypothetical protein
VFERRGHRVRRWPAPGRNRVLSRARPRVVPRSGATISSPASRIVFVPGFGSMPRSPLEDVHRAQLPTGRAEWPRRRERKTRVDRRIDTMAEACGHNPTPPRESLDPEFHREFPEEFADNCNRHGCGVIVAMWLRDASGPARRHARLLFHGDKIPFRRKCDRAEQNLLAFAPLSDTKWQDCGWPIASIQRGSLVRVRTDPGRGSGRESG